MNLIQVHLRAEFEFYKKNNIRVLHTGDFSGLHSSVQAEIIAVKNDTAHFDGLTIRSTLKQVEYLVTLSMKPVSIMHYKTL